MSLGSDLWVWTFISDYIQDYFADLTDVTLAVDDSNLVPSDDFKRAILGKWKCKWCHLMANIETNTSGNTW